VWTVQPAVIEHDLPPPPAPTAPSLSPRGLAIAGWVALVVAIAAFGTLAWNVEESTRIVQWDATVTGWVTLHRGDFFVAAMTLITQVNSVGGVFVLSAIFAGVLLRMREFYWTLTLALAVGGGALLNVLLKALFERARPQVEDPLLILHSYSFPSGHTAGATLFYGVLAAFLVSRTRNPRLRIAIVALAIVLVLLVALSRVYLGVHYLSDVVAAMCSSTAWLVLCLAGVHRLVRRRLAER
jgi:membrane-associated phospholipid phosphatase